jgi:hypothetical protein
MGDCYPVLLLAWRRPETVKKVIASVRSVAPEVVYVACDGPNPASAEEAEKVSETRRMIDNEINWDCRILKFYSDTNQGCRRGVEKAITWFFEHESEGIILEDDCVPHADFFSFCAELLERYRNDQRVACITGDNFQSGARPGGSSYYFSKYPHCWGWATWRRAWTHYSAEFDFWPAWKKSKHWRHLFLKSSERQHWEMVFDSVHQGRTDSWALPWMACVWRASGLTATPQENLVQNIGFGKDASHTNNSSSKLSLPARGLGLTLRHPAHVLPDQDADDYVFRNVFAGTRARNAVASKFSTTLRRFLMGS